jgi:tetratricopeptide (TPR) repeat protein
MSRRSAAERLKERVVAGQEAFAAGRLEEAAAEWSAALRSAQRLATPEALRTTLRNNLAGLYHSLGRRSEARRMYEQALRAAERKHGAESQPVATILNNLAELERSGGSPARAEPLFQRALGILEKLSGESSQLANVLANLAECIREQGRLDEALALNSRALAILESQPSQASGAMGVLLNNLARIEEQREKYREAEDLYTRATALLGQGGPAFEEHRRAALANYAAALRRHAAAIERELGACLKGSEDQRESTPGNSSTPRPSTTRR